MIELKEALRTVREYAREKGAAWFRPPPDGLVDRPGYWFFHVGYIGSAGVIVDKDSGRLHVMGSGLSLDDMFWGHENGFSGERQILRVTKVNDTMETVEFLFYAVSGGPGSTRDPHPRRAWLEQLLRELPVEFRSQSLWLSIPAFRHVRETTKRFEFQVAAETA